MRQLMGLRKELACLAVIFFILVLLETSSIGEPDIKAPKILYVN
jgi:hypothetical protein